MTDIAFLGMGNFLATGRYWNSFVINRSILVEPCPTVLPHLRRCGIGIDEINLIAISHFHADHTFGWPFLLLELVRSRRSRPLTIVGPPGVEAYLAEMLDLGGVPNIAAAARSLDLRFTELDSQWHRHDGVAVRGVAVEHVEHLASFGLLFDLGDQTIGYSGDTRPCDGLVELGQHSDVLIIECNDHYAPTSLPLTHMDVASVHDLQRQFPDLALVLTHLGPDVHADLVPGPSLLTTSTMFPSKAISQQRTSGARRPPLRACASAYGTTARVTSAESCAAPNARPRMRRGSAEVAPPNGASCVRFEGGLRSTGTVEPRRAFWGALGVTRSGRSPTLMRTKVEGSPLGASGIARARLGPSAFRRRRNCRSVCGGVGTGRAPARRL